MTVADAIALSFSLQFRESFPSPIPFPYQILQPYAPGGWMDGAEAAKFQRSSRKFHVDCTVQSVPAVL